MADNKDPKPIKVIPLRYVGSKRIYSNYIEVTKSPTDISIKFCDIKPPENEKEIENVKSKGQLEIMVEAEIVIPLSVAKEFLKALQVQFPSNEEKS